MSETNSRFKMKKGDIEIEYEGTSKEVSSKFSEIFEWLKGVPLDTPFVKTKKASAKSQSAQIERKQNESGHGRRGGARSRVISPAIDAFLENGFFDDFKNAEQTLAKLKENKVPADLNAVNEALKRRVGKTLDGITGEEGKQVFRKKTQIG